MTTEESFNCDRSCYRSRGMMNDKLLETNWNFHLCCAQRHTYTRARVYGRYSITGSPRSRGERKEKAHPRTNEIEYMDHLVFDLLRADCFNIYGNRTRFYMILRRNKNRDAVAHVAMTNENRKWMNRINFRNLIHLRERSFVPPSRQC